MTYSRISQSAAAYQVTEYPNYISRALHKKATFYKCCLSFSELAHTIESCEYQYQTAMGNPFGGMKAFRNDPTSRGKVLGEIAAAHSVIGSMAKKISLNVVDKAVEFAHDDIKAYPLDVYNAFNLQAMKKQNLFRIITDDSDYASVPGIEIHTANRTLISDAKQQGKLITFGTSL